MIWCCLALVAYWVWLDRGVITAFESRRWDLPARIYANPLEIYQALELSREQLTQALRDLGYRKVAAPSGAGQFASSAAEVRVHTRGFAFSDGPEIAREVLVRFAADRVASIRERRTGNEVGLVRFEPLEIGRIHPASFEDRVLLGIDEVPEYFVRALVAVEDRRFYDHVGIDLIGIARAAWANILARSITQGGSTLTQQLVKNLYLSHERSLWRKFNEAMMALSIEREYGKREIIETYINEVFLGQDGNRAIHGFGLAAQFYFGRPLAELSLPEYALLIGIIRGPSYYNPYAHPERAVARRNSVLQTLHQSGIITDAEYRAQLRVPLELRRGRWRGDSRYAAFVDLVKRQLRRDYKESDLQTAGLKIFTTLDVVAQRAAEGAVESVLSALAGNRTQGTLQTAVVITDARTADIKALIGDRAGDAGGFNRALDAQRPIGSLMKPFVYMTALADAARFNAATRLADEPRTWPGPKGTVWAPKNYDGRYHGPVALQDAIAQSLNLATLDLGFRVGIERVLGTLRRLGYPGELPNYPALFLGALAMPPYEVAQLYQVIANDGFRIPLRAIRAVVDSGNQPIASYGLRVERVVDAPTAFLTRYLLTRVVEAGTARAIGRVFPAALPIAGKTGTSDDARDSWFAGFGGNDLAVVWIGRDDNKPTGLTGATGALRVWIEIMRQLGVKPVNMEPPPTIEWHWLAADGTALSARDCAGAVLVPVNIEHLPQAVQNCAGDFNAAPNAWDRLRGIFQ